MPNTSRVRIRNIRKSYGQHVALKDIDLDIPAGVFFTLLGPSGCGKTTLLRVIGGFHLQDAGDILVGDQSIARLGASQRNVGMVFQDYAVFPHLSVFDNVAFGLVQRKVAPAELRQRVQEMLKMVQLDALGERLPHQLSGGQQQRVGLARAMVIRPKVLLMDEPLSNLDAKLRVDLRRDIRQLQQEFGITTIYVTHDQEEALSISDQVCVMFDGVVQQVGTPWDIYHRPLNRFVASFVGANNFLPTGAVHADAVSLLGQPMPAPASVRGQAGMVAAVRPEKVVVNQPPRTAGLQVSGILRHSMFTGRELQLSVEVQGHGRVEALTAPDETMVGLRIGETVSLAIQVADVLYFAAGETGARLA